MVRVCFVCLGNICRSPTGEGVMRHLLAEAGIDDRVEVDSAGTGAWHVGEQADARARATARSRGLSLTSIARQFVTRDLDEFDYVIAMDRSNLRNIERLVGGRPRRAAIHLLRSLDPNSTDALDVPDPYYEDNFDEVFDICEAGCRGLLVRIRAEHGLP